MAQITKIEEQKNKQRVNIFVDDAFFCGLLKETAVIFGLKIGKEIDENKLKEAIFDSEVKTACEKATSLIASRMHSKKEIFEKLLLKGYEKQVIERAIEKLEEYHYVDDELFTKQFIEQNQKHSKRMIENKLKQKGVNTEFLAKINEIRDENHEIELCKALAEKYAKSKDVSNKENQQKMYASLSRRGFSFDVIKKACAHLINDSDDFDSYDLNN